MVWVRGAERVWGWSWRLGFRVSRVSFRVQGFGFVKRVVLEADVGRKQRTRQTSGS